MSALGGDQEDERKQTTADVSLFNLGGAKTGGPCSPGMSLAGTRLLARWCPAWRWREPDLLLLHETWEDMPRHGCPMWTATGSASSG